MKKQKKNLTGHKGGVVIQSKILKNGIELVSNDEQHHHLIVGTTGSGKTQQVVIPTIVSNAISDCDPENGIIPPSMVINDPKGELYALTANYLKNQGYKVILMDYFQPKSGMCFNQMYLVEKHYEKALPHLFAAQGLSLLIKTIDAIITSGESNDFKKYQNIFKEKITKMDREKYGNERIALAKDGSGYITELKACDKIQNQDLDKIAKFTPDQFCALMMEFATALYGQVETDLNTDVEPTTFLHNRFNNEYVSNKQSRTIQAIIDLIPRFEKKYAIASYMKKIDIQKKIMEKDNSIEIIEQCQMYISEYESAIDNIKNSFDLISLRAYMVELLKDHETMWKLGETKAVTTAGSLAMILVQDTGGDAFWTDTARALLKSMILFVARESNIKNSKHLGSVNRMLSELTEMDRDDKTALDKLFNNLLPGDAIKLAQGAVKVAGDKTKSSILSTAITAMQIFSNFDVVEQASKTELDPAAFVRDKTAVFLCTPGSDDAGTAQFTILSTLFIEQFYSSLNELLLNDVEQTLPRPVYFLIDELANIKAIPNLAEKITLARSKNMRFTMIVQSLEQLKDVYKGGAETIKENANLLYLLSNNIQTSKEISEKLGKKTIEVQSFSSSTNDKSTSSSTSTSQQSRDLMTHDELMKMEAETGLYMLSRKKPYLTHLTPIYKWDIYKYLSAHKLNAIHYNRPAQEVNYFCPPTYEVTKFNFAYSLFAEDCSLDAYMHQILSSIEIHDDNSTDINNDRIDLTEELELEQVEGGFPISDFEVEPEFTESVISTPKVIKRKNKQN